MELVLGKDEQVMQSMEMIMVQLWVVERVIVGVGVWVEVRFGMVLEELMVGVLEIVEEEEEVSVEEEVPSLEVLVE